MAKLRAQASRALDLFRTLREKYAMLRPLAFDQTLAARIGTGPRAHAHAILRNALLESCVQDLVKLTTDGDPRTPSIPNIMSTLESADVREALKGDYSVRPILVRVGGDPMPPEYEALLRNRESERLSAEFDSALAELVEAWQRVSSDTSTAAFKTWRDKVIAHSELHHKDGTYTPIDLAVLGLKWGDLGLLIEEVQRVIAGIGSVVRSAGFAWSILDEQLNDASTSFWAALAAAPRRAV